jgi:pyruvate formate lyase activating enzyme
MTRRTVKAMRIAGLQKLTLLDYPGKVACTVFTQGCAFRCPFCHNASLVLPEREQPPIDEEETLAYLKKRAGILDGVCISGGEPLLQRDIGDFIKQVKALGYHVKLDTNGGLPDALERLIREGLIDFVAMDIKNAPERYAETIGIAGYDPAPVLRSAALLMGGATAYEFRTTVVRELHEKNNFSAIGQWLRGAGTYFLQGFRDSGDLIKQGLSACSPDEMQAMADLVRPYIPNVKIRGI